MGGKGRGLQKQKFLLNVFFIYIQCVFFMRTKVNANLTHLYLIKINDWCLIFSIMFGHLIIHKEIQVLTIMLPVKSKNLKLIGFQFCCVESRICHYTKLNICSYWWIWITYVQNFEFLHKIDYRLLFLLSKFPTVC